MNKERLAFTVGLFLIICFAGGIYALIVVGKLGETFERHRIIEVIFDNAQGVKRGAPVLYAGVHIGTVKEVGVEHRRGAPPAFRGPKHGASPFQVRLKLRVREDRDSPITYEDIVTIYAPLVMGEPDVRIVPLGGKEPYHPGKPLTGVSHQDITEMLGDSMVELGTTLRNVRLVSEKIKDVASDEKGVVGVLTSKDVADGLVQTLQDFRLFTRSIRSIGVSDLLADNKIADRIVAKWWEENVTRTTPADKAFAKWKEFVQNQRELSKGLIYADPTFPDGPPWKQQKLQEWRRTAEKDKDEMELLRDFRKWKDAHERQEYEQWKKSRGEKPESLNSE